LSECGFLCFYAGSVKRGDATTVSDLCGRARATFVANPQIAAVTLALLALVVVVVKNGVGLFPSWPFLLNLAENWSDPSLAPLLVPPADYLKGNFVAAWLAGVLGFASPHSYLGFNLALTAAAIVLPFIMPVMRREVRTTALLFIAVVGGPIAVLLLTWVGGYDAVSVLGIVIAALAHRPIVSAMGWLIVGVNHPSLALLGFAVWIPILALTSDRFTTVRKTLASLLGVSAGALLSVQVVDAWGGATNRWEWFVTNEQMPTVVEIVAIFLPALFGAVGVVWFIFLRPSFLRTWVVRVLVAEIVVLTIVLPFLVLDVTRVIALVMFAPLLTWIAVCESTHGCRSVGALDRQLLLPAIIVPIPLVWEGNVFFGNPASTLSVFQSLELPEWYPQ
jgi:hypothetical protein